MRSVWLLILTIFAALPSRSQLCNGSLGDPVARISFGSGTPNQGPPLAPGKTNYNFVTQSCPLDGNYTITNATAGCFGQTWHSLSQDHTPDDNGGYFMLVNASLAPGVFYVDTVSALCGGTTYEFSAYVINMLRIGACNNQGIPPDLTFTIETISGTVLTTYNTGRIPSQSTPSWVQYGTFITTPTGISTVVIRITNNAPGGCGNDLAIDDIAFRPCGPNINAGIEGTISTDTALCEPTAASFTLKANFSNQYQDPRFQWQVSRDEGQTWQDIAGANAESYVRTATSVGTYQYRALIADGNNILLPSCRIASKPVTFRVFPQVIATAGPNVSACLGNSVSLSASGGAIYSWSGPGGFTSSVQNPSFILRRQDSGVYIVRATTNGCSDTASLLVSPLPNSTISLLSPVNVCEGRSIQLSASGGDRIKWSPPTGLSNDTIYNPVATVTASTAYRATISNSFGCSDTGTVQVIVVKAPTANAGPDINMLSGKPIAIRSSATGVNVSYAWTPPLYLDDPTKLSPKANPPSDTRYRLTVTSNDGCGSSSDEVLIRVFDMLKVPNTFTPNGDGYNDVWQIDQLRAFDRCVIEVYNTAGQLVYRDIGYSRPWDGRNKGRDLPAGTYYYVIDLKWEEVGKLTGYITIIR